MLAKGFARTGLWPWDEGRLDKEGAFACSDVLMDLSPDNPKVLAAKALSPEQMGVQVQTVMDAYRPELQEKAKKASDAVLKADGVDLSNLFVSSPEYMEGVLKTVAAKDAEEKVKEERKEKRGEEKEKRKRREKK